METAQRLRDETNKWLAKIQADLKRVELLDKGRESELKNIFAYISDCEHFIEKGDYVLAFEAIVWAWSWLEILERLNVLRRK
jgi:hypothetical protein